MDIHSLSPLRTGLLAWQHASGAWRLTVVCKATYQLEPEVSHLHRHQEDINDDDNHWDDDPNRSVFVPTDLVPTKVRADVLLVGHAFAPGKVPVRSLLARMVVGEVDKTIEVYGNRALMPSGEVVLGSSFSTMSVGYERAAGGPDTWNPVGLQLDVKDALGRVTVPNLQPPGHTFLGKGDSIPAIGFGPIAPTWPHRIERLGRYPVPSTPKDWQRQPLPADLDMAFFNVAPRDQQLDELQNDERILLQNLHSDHPRLVTNLVGVKPRVFAVIPGRTPQDVAMRADTLWIDTDRGICTLTWRGQLPLGHPAEKGTILVAMEEPGRRLSWVDVQRLARSEAVVSQANDDSVRTAELPAEVAASGKATETLYVDPSVAPEPTLPFAPTVADVKGTPATAPLVRAPAEPLSPWAGGSGASARLPEESPRASALQGLTADKVALPGAVSLPLNMSISPLPPTAGASPPEKPAAVGGLLAASNAAADPARSGLESSVAKPKPEGPRERPREILELIWYDPAALPRIRRHLGWKKIIAGLKPRPSDDDFDGGLPPEQMKAAKDKRDVFGVLARGEVQDLAGIRRAMEMAIADDGSFVPPYVLTAGTLEFPFDEVETLKAMMVVVAPFVPGDKKLKETTDLVWEVLRTPGIERARGVAEGLIARVRAAFGETARGLPAGYLDAQVEPMLLEGRCYQTRLLRGRTGTRALFTFADTDCVADAFGSEELREGSSVGRSACARILAQASWRGPPNENMERLLSLELVALATTST